MVVMKLDPEIMRQLMLMFKVELGEQSQLITEGLLELEKGISGVQREECLDGIFRAAHNIKGAARGIDAKDIASIAHSLETLFSKFRREEMAVSSESIDRCLLGLDRMKLIMTALESNQPPGFDIQDLLDLLNGQSAAQPESKSKSELAHAVEEKISVGPEASIESIKQLEQAIPVLAIASNPLSTSIVESRVVDENTETIRVSLHKLDQFSALVEDLLISKIEMEEHLDAIKRLFDESQSFYRDWLQYLETIRKANAVVHAGQEHDSLETMTAVLNRFRTDTQQLYKQMRDGNNRAGLTFFRLQDQVRALYLVPVATQLQPMARLVRDVAHELEKKVNFEIIGGDIEMDRPILEGIKDPLIHLLRNAIDHGIESPQQRRAKDKPEIGRLTVVVNRKNDRVLMTINDDGAGIDVDTVARYAVRKKILTQHEIAVLSKAEIIQLIFRPGFSSKEIVTDISGRGVGLDVVLTSIRHLKGRITVDTVEGKGTTFALSLPLTLSADRGLLVRVSGSVFAIPIAAIERVMEIRQDDLVEIGGSQAILIENKAISIRDLSAVLEIGQFRYGMSERLPLVVISKGWQRVALLVEEIISEREIVIKRLKPPLKSVRNVMGATFVGSSDVIVVLNPDDLVISALRLGSAAQLSVQEQTTVEKEVHASHILVVDDSITIRTFEKTLLEACGYQVTVAVNGKAAWNLLQRQNFDLIITDIEMPLMNGFELSERIKRSEKFRNIPIVIVSSLSSEVEKRRGIEVGANAYIVKNQFESKVLLDVIQQLIG
ncbi:two-component system chemotaxis sensor kinase CheA [Nitrosomonas sp. Nm84]|uniref:hybrid sensor histidine kinase/response regulator n=1 Tax=Nitrosomonas sp. Nm84 TaxID=200124 RepID=UPI000D759A0A|nr:hybrid sensor histidine kinase/response regulator [Nitrosomonas sp. Nm84]PXW86434.1 two-component system chemotaxis sensor kinase CheA [Nitrosomonas sp. Nm84]